MWSHLSDELDDLDKDVEGRVSRHDQFGAAWEQTVDDALEAARRRRVALTLDPNHVNPTDSQRTTMTVTQQNLRASV